jgi:hypothetical protein
MTVGEDPISDLRRIVILQTDESLLKNPPEFTAKGGELHAKTSFFVGADFSAQNLFRNVETRHARTSSLQRRENVSASKTNKPNDTIKTITMKYALFVHVNKEAADQTKDAKAAGMAYGEALRAAGIFVAGAGLESPQTATVVSVRNGKRQVQDGPYAETKEFLGWLGQPAGGRVNAPCSGIGSHCARARPGSVDAR